MFKIRKRMGEKGTRSNLTCLANILKVICHKILSKLKLPFISEFRFDLAHAKMLNDTHMMVMEINYTGDTEQKL